MDGQELRILLIEDNPGDARLIQEFLAEKQRSFSFPGRQMFVLECTRRLSTGLERLAEGGVDVVLLDLGLPDSHGLETFVTMYAQEPKVPVVLLTSLIDEELAIQTVQQGAQDYLVKGEIDNNLLVRALRYAIERHRLQEALRGLSLVDDLTGLYNRRGFFAFANQHLILAHRKRIGLSLLYADLDDLKEINDTFGHLEGDQALIRIGQILKETFRAADIIARLGGDEFAVLALETVDSSAEVLISRLQENLEVHNQQEGCYTLSLSVGRAWWDPKDPCSLEELLAWADQSMYEQKRKRESQVMEEGKGKHSNACLKCIGQKDE